VILALGLAAAATAATAACVAARLFPRPRPLGDRAALGALLGVLLPMGEVRALGAGHFLTRGALVVAMLALAALALLATGRAARAQAREDARTALAILGAAVGQGTARAVAWVGLGALFLAGLVAYALPPWAWDAVGYHLPIVYDALQTHALRTVPTNIPYVNVYPRAIETFFVAFRLLVDDDTMIDFAQAPFAIVAAVGIAAFARRAGASAGRAAAYGLAYAAVPLVTLQLASDYVDVGVAALLVAAVYFASGPLERADLLAWGLATGAFLGSKPSAPPVVVLLSAVVLVRAHRLGRLGPAAGAAALAFALGAEKYVGNLIAHGNPIWPIELHAGPITLAGEDDARALMLHGLPDSLVRGGWLLRLVVSLFVEPAAYVYDMRLGGLGPMTALGLIPIALVFGWRVGRPAFPLMLLAACALASPAAHWMRYTLALPAALLALAAAAVELRGARARVVADLGIAVLAVVGLVRAQRGFTGGELSLPELFARPPALRAVAVGVDGHEADWRRARSIVGAGEAFAYDRSFSLPGLLWCGDGRARTVYLGNVATADAALEAVRREDVRVLVAGDLSPAATAVARDPSRFAELFRCPLDACTVYEVLPARAVAQGAP
jgi:hypothetical protein